MNVRRFVSIRACVFSPVNAAMVLLLILLPLMGCRHRVVVQPDKITSYGADAGQYTKEEYLNDFAWYNLTSGYPERDNDQKLVVRHDQIDLSQAKMARDKIVYGLMGQIDMVYADYYRHTFAGKNTVAIVGDVLVLGLGAGGTIATNVATKTIFAALGTSFSGLNLSVDKNLYAQQSFQVIGIAMQTRRDKVRAYIVQSLTQEIADYPLAKAKRDLIAYMSAGTLAAGLQELQEEAGAATALPKTSTSSLPPAPAAPAKLYAVAGASSITLIWTPVAGATSYSVYRSTSSDVSPVSGLQLVQVADGAFEDKRPPNGTSYYVVTAINSGGESVSSQSASAQPSGAAVTNPIGAPASVKVVGNGTENVVGWSSVAGAKAYAIKFATSTNALQSATVHSGLATPFYIHKNITANQSFFYVVAAVNTDGTLSDYTDPVSPAAAPAPSATPVTPPAPGNTAAAPVVTAPAAAVQAVNPVLVRPRITTDH